MVEQTGGWARMTENDGESDNTSIDLLDGLSQERRDALARKVENALEAENSIDESRDASGTEVGRVEEAETTDGDTGEAGTGTEDNSTDDDDRTPDSEITEEADTSEVPEYESGSIYLADPELTKYRHTYFKRLELEFPELRGCHQREMQRALLAEAMQNSHRKAVRDRAVKYLERRKQREQ
jgi:hypothetical protein